MNTLKPQPRLGDTPFLYRSSSQQEQDSCVGGDPLAPARGIFNAFVISVVVWVVLTLIWRVYQ